MYKLLGVKKLHGYLIQHGGHGQYFIIAISGIKLLKNYDSLFIIHLRCSRRLSGKGSARQCRRCKRPGFEPWVGKVPWSRKWQLTPVFLPEKFHGLRSLVGYSLGGLKESDTTERTAHGVRGGVMLPLLPLGSFRFCWMLKIPPQPSSPPSLRTILSSQPCLLSCPFLWSH